MRKLLSSGFVTAAAAGSLMWLTSLGQKKETRVPIRALPNASAKNWDPELDLQLFDLLRLSDAENPIRPNFRGKEDED
jgi:hypothetical protein